MFGIIAKFVFFKALILKKNTLIILYRNYIFTKVKNTVFKGTLIVLIVLQYKKRDIYSLLYQVVIRNQFLKFSISDLLGEVKM